LDLQDDPFYTFVQESPILEFQLVSIPGQAPTFVNHQLVFTEERLKCIHEQRWHLHLRCFILKKSSRNPLIYPSPSHNWPSNCILRINNFNIELQTEDEKKKTLPLAADITAHCRPGTNYLQMSTTTFITHHVAVQLNRKLSVTDLLHNIITSKAIPLQHTIQTVKDSFERQTSEVLTTSTKLSLMDPLKLSRIITPGRGSSCRHIQCFDLENYLLMNERIRRWLCPVCNQPAKYEDLQYDSYFASILEALKSDSVTSGVVLTPEGIWSLEAPKQITKSFSEESNVTTEPQEKKNQTILHLTVPI